MTEELNNMTEGKVFSAKQVATRIGTDAKTLRKFFRSPASDFEAVGQGGRYEFPANMLPAIQEAFKKWEAGKGTAPAAKASTPAKGQSRRTRGPKIDREPGEHRGLPMVPPSITRKQKLTEFEQELVARGKARDEEYGTIDGEEPTEEDIEELDLELEDLELDDEDED